MSQRIEWLVRSIARARPDAVAISDWRRLLSYSELDHRSDELGANLRSFGVEKGEPVALCAERSAELVVGALGILKSGGAFVALDPSDPDERLAFMIQDSGARFVLGTSATSPEIRLQMGFMEIDLSGPAPRHVISPTSVGDSNDVAYVVYTSGTTGTPKGVMVRHGSICNMVKWHHGAFRLTPADRGTQIASPGFDAAVWEIWPYMTAGASIHIPSEDIRLSATALSDWILANAITIAFAPTVLAEELVSVSWPTSAQLRTLLTGGDVLMHSPRPGLPFDLINNYGVTEATVVSTSGVVPPREAETGRPSIGRPISGVRVHLVDSDLKPVSDGEEGEIVICGPTVAAGYLNRPELTQQRFQPNHLEGTPHETLYRTGDLARWRPDGELEFVGRVDDQVAIRGVRVELGEVAAVLNAHPDVRTSVVLATGFTGDRRLVAHVVPVRKPPPDSSRLRQHLRRYLPDSMIPTSFVWWGELPTNSNGKIDRSFLSAAIADAFERDLEPPRNETESTIALLVAELLGLEAVGIHEDFFLLGGHSLLGTQLITRLSRIFGVELSLRAMFENPTVVGLADEVERSILVSSLSDEEVDRMLSDLTSEH